MDIDTLTFGKIKEIMALVGGGSASAGQAPSQNPHIGKHCIIRCSAAGVHTGVLLSQNGQQVELRDARRLWQWVNARGISLSDTAVYGITDESRITATVPEITLLDAIEIIPTSDASRESIHSAPVDNGGRD